MAYSQYGNSSFGGSNFFNSEPKGHAEPGFGHTASGGGGGAAAARAAEDARDANTGIAQAKPKAGDGGGGDGNRRSAVRGEGGDNGGGGGDGGIMRATRARKDHKSGLVHRQVLKILWFRITVRASATAVLVVYLWCCCCRFKMHSARLSSFFSQAATVVHAVLSAVVFEVRRISGVALHP